jgi:hypothetical protein
MKQRTKSSLNQSLLYVPCSLFLIIRYKALDVAYFGFMNLNIAALVATDIAGFSGVKMILAGLLFLHRTFFGDKISFSGGFVSFYLRHICEIKNQAVNLTRKLLFIR